MSNLKDLYKDYFTIGAACEIIHDMFTNNEIGNKDKENLLLKEFNSMTFANELKPAYNMGWNSPYATEDYLPFVLNPNAEKMLKFAVDNNMKVRGHVLVWHSQCPKEIFCKGYKPVTFPTDPEVLKERPFMKNFEKLNPVCYVDRATLLKRLESYIDNVMKYMYENGYASTIYAWDVVNEAIELMDKQPTGLRNSYWYQIIGDDFIYWAFKFARTAVDRYSKEYADKYGAELKPLLFYNDYNEFQPDKKKAIIDALQRSTDDHGSILGEKLIDGIGMQGHISDNNNIDEYIEALMDYSSLVDTVHITELDVKSTCLNINAEYYQAVFYKNFFEALIKANEKGAKLKNVTLWGLTDDNSWIRGANPLLFRGDLSPKKSYFALKFALTGESLGEPEKIVIDLSDRKFDFEPVDGKLPELKDIGFKTRGFAHIAVQNKTAHTGSYALAHEIRFDDWSGISFDVTDFLGQTIDVRAWVKSPAETVYLKADIDKLLPLVAEVKTGTDEWVELKGRYKVPADVHSLFLFFGTTEKTEDKFSPIYVDDIEIKLVGLEESFENRDNIASIRGMGHLPIITVTDKESVDGESHSLLITRHEKDATVKFNISSYIGQKISIRAYVKTADNRIKMGIDGSEPFVLADVEAVKDGWTLVEAKAVLDENMNSAEFFIETDGNADYFVDDIFVTKCR